MKDLDKLNKRFDMLEHLLVRHADTAPRSISNQYAEIKTHMKVTSKSIEKMNATLSGHNGRLTKVEIFIERIKGASLATKTIWAFLAVIVMASIFGMFQMYIEFQQLPYTIGLIVDEKILELNK